MQVLTKCPDIKLQADPLLVGNKVLRSYETNLTFSCPVPYCRKLVMKRREVMEGE